MTKKYANMLLTPRFRDAFNLVFEMDANHPRKGTDIPYLAHLMAVCSMVLYAGGDEDQACAALLHDTIEDHAESVTLESLASRFGDRVAEMVAALSDTPENYRGGPKPEWKTRKEAYLKHLAEAKKEVLLISVADKLDNARAILSDYRQVGPEVWSRFKRGRDDQIYYFKKLIEIYRQAGLDNFIFNDLVRVVDELEQETK